MARVPVIIEFHPDDAGDVTDRMRAMAAADDGWITLQPGFDEADLPAGASSSFFSIFSGIGPPVPECTWTPTEIGVRHGSGPKALARLAELGCTVPAGWRPLQDHPKRGLVLVIPRDADPAEVLAWLLRAGQLLTRVPLTGDWRAAIY